MSKYYIDVQINDELICDQEGSECVDLAQAQMQAVGVLRQAAKDVLSPTSNSLLISTIRDTERKAVYIAKLEFRSCLVVN